MNWHCLCGCLVVRTDHNTDGPLCVYMGALHMGMCVGGCSQNTQMWTCTHVHRHKHAFVINPHTPLCITHTRSLAKPCSFPLGEIVAVLIYHSLHWVCICSLLHWWGFHFFSSQTKQKLRWRSCVCSVLRMSRSVLAGWQPSDSSRYVTRGCSGCISHRTTGCGSILAQKRYVVPTIKSELTYQV